jgi:hypothetical protein
MADNGTPAPDDNGGRCDREPCGYEITTDGNRLRCVKWKHDGAHQLGYAGRVTP